MNGLYPTPVRRALMAAIHAGGGRVYYEAAAKQVRDSVTDFAVTARVYEMVRAGWIEAEKVDAQTKRTGELAGRTYYRITAVGRSVLEGHRR